MTVGGAMPDGGEDASEPRTACDGRLHFEDETERAALIQEYGFVSSLIPMYRRLEIQAVQLSLIIVAAAAGFIGEALRDNPLAAYFAAASLPLLLSFVLLAICGMEVRIIRASRFLDRTVGQRMKELTRGRQVLKWERSPGLHLDRLQRRFQSSWTYILIIVAPGVLAAAGVLWGSAAGLEGEAREHRALLLVLTVFGLCFLLTWGIAAVRISGRHEGRGLSLKGLWTRSLRTLPGIPASDLRHATDCSRVDLFLKRSAGGTEGVYGCASCGALTTLRRMPGEFVGVHEDTAKTSKAISLGVAGGAAGAFVSFCEVVAPYGQSSTAAAEVRAGEKLPYPSRFDNAPELPLDDGTYRIRWFCRTDIGRRLASEDAFEIRDGRVAW